MTFIFRQVWREIKNSRSFCLFYAVNLALGLSGFVLVDSLKESLQKKVTTESKELLGADLALRARRPITPEEISLVRRTTPRDTVEALAVDFFSMASGPTGRSRLVKVVAMDPGFPFYGKFDLQFGQDLPQKEIDNLHQIQSAWMYPEAKAQLGIDRGESLKLGNLKFQLANFVEEESGLSFQPTDLAPKVFISRNFLEQTGLMGQGNLAFHTLLLRLPDGTDTETFGEALERAIKSPEVRVYSHQKTGHRAGRLLRYLSDFLSLVSLVSLFLACLGSGFLFHGFLVNRLPELAVLICLGTPRSTVLTIFSFLLAILGILAALPACLACIAFLPALSLLIEGIGTKGLHLLISTKSIILTFGVAIASGWLLSLPALNKIRRLQPIDLFREAARPGAIAKRFNLFASLPGLLAFWILCLTQANSDKLANVFFLCFLGSLVVLYFLSRFGFLLLERLLVRTALPLRLAARSLSRNRAGAVTGFLALSLGVLLLTLIPQTQHGLSKEIGLDNAEGELPSLFLFDLQEEQLEEVQSFLASHNSPLNNLTPWVRGKIKTIKGLPYEKSIGEEKEINNPDEQRRDAFRNRSFNLSYRAHLLESEELISGRPFSGTYDTQAGRLVELSVEQKYAKALGIEVGDHMGIEVAGLHIDAEVVNLRRVRWTSFQPNFFVQAQPGVLENAPKTFLGTIHDLSQEDKNRLQDLLVQKFPTVSILDVERTGRKILQIVGQMTWALQLMATLSVLAGLLILFCVVKEKARSQRWEVNLQKVLGCTLGQLRRQIWMEFGILGVTASIIGTSLSLITSYLLSVQIFDRVWSFRWDLPLLVIFCVVTLSVVTANFAARRVLHDKPIKLLREGS